MLPTNNTHETAPTQFVDVNGTNYAYRTFGKTGGVPLIFLQHFTGTMDNWDPLVTNGLARTHQVVLFDNAGVGSSAGETPTSVASMAQDAAAFIRALGFERVDVLGFSLGNFVAQQLTLDHPELVQRLILVGGGPVGQGSDAFVTAMGNVGTQAQKHPLLYLFFEPSAASQQLGEAFVQRLESRATDRDQATSQAAVGAQYQAIVGWGEVQDPEFARLRQITQPALVVNGSNDIMVPTSQSNLLFQHLPAAQLSLYPDAGHGSLFQYPALFVEQATYFLETH